MFSSVVVVTLFRNCHPSGSSAAFIEEELLRLSQVFHLHVVAYAVMSNHCHVVLSIDRKLVVRNVDGVTVEIYQ